MDLFEDMRSKMGVTYISDLRYAVPKICILQALNQLEIECYPLNMWAEFLQYVGVGGVEIGSYEELSWFLMQKVMEASIYCRDCDVL